MVERPEASRKGSHACCARSAGFGARSSLYQKPLPSQYVLDTSALLFSHRVLLDTVDITFNIKEGVNASWQVRNVSDRDPDKVIIYLIAGAALAKAG